MARDYLRTSDISKAVGVHPNTVRLYEEWGFLPPIPRSPGGYRQFTESHLNQMHLARLALNDDWPGRNIRRSAVALVRQAASGDLNVALKQARQHLALVHTEQQQAEAAAEYLEQWAQGHTVDPALPPLTIGQTAELLAVTVDTLRTWERNGLLTVPRHPKNKYRQYGPAEIGRLRVIRMVRRAGYSTMAVLRMVIQFDRGQRHNLRQILDTPRPDEDMYYAADQWLSHLIEQEQRAHDMIAHIEMMIKK